MGPDDRRAIPRRLGLIQAAMIVVFAALTIAFWYFQVVQHERFEEMAENNHQRTLELRAPRGGVFDRHGRVIVENRRSFNISIVREQSRDLERAIPTLAEAVGLPDARIRAVVDRSRRLPQYRPIVVVEDASVAQIAAVSARRLELPEVVIEQAPTRRYPDRGFAAHVIGYVGEVSESQLLRPGFQGMRVGDIVGQSGVEQAYNHDLMGQNGARRVVVNSVGREIRMLDEVDPVEGRRVQLTIDFDVQRAVEEAFHALGYNGSAVILDPRSGEVLALVSLPAYDPNAFATGIDRVAWDSLNADRLRPLQNRALQGRYSPGSTFKVAMAVAALEEGVVTPDHKIFCGGGGNFYGRYFLCNKREGHGWVDLRHAIERSCNVYFYTVGNMLGVDRIHKWATALGLGVRSGIDLPHEVEGLVPSTSWKKARYNEKWYAGETISVAIGQGQVSVTPISLAVMMATVANGGVRRTPHLIKAVDEGDGWKATPPVQPQSIVQLKPETLSAVRDGLWMAVNAAGTARRARLDGYDVAGKTGTAQVISNLGRAAAGQTERDLRDHGWFVFFARRDNAEIAGVVFAEHSEHGYLAAPIAKHAIDTYFAKKEGRTLPVFEAPAAPAPVAAATTAAAGTRNP
jgi:penicillin-binding protein 2